MNDRLANAVLHMGFGAMCVALSLIVEKLYPSNADRRTFAMILGMLVWVVARVLPR